MFRVNNFDKLLDKATSNLRLDPDWPTILQICDLIRQNDCTPKYAIAAIKKKMYSQNPHQAMFGLLVLESIVKNCGSGVHDEVASKGFCETLRDLVKSTQHENLKTKILELIQAWAFAFRNTPKYRSVQDTVNILKAEGFKFPALKESDAMFSADTAPEWADGEVCHRCRVAFSLIVRRHHCRACGQVFCQQCSSKTSTLPKFGIEKEVRVCDACFDKVSKPPPANTKLDIVDTSSDYGPTQSQKRPGKSAEELQEEEELQLALALSQSEAEQKEKERKSRSYIAPESQPQVNASPTRSSVTASPETGATANAELSRYLDRNYWEQRVRESPAAPTAPSTSSEPASSDLNDFTKVTTGKTAEEDAEEKELDEFVGTLKSQVEIFVNRMKSNSSRGRSIANDTSVQTLFMNITAMHSKLLRCIQEQDDKRVYLESLQDKVAQVRDSRAALDTLRAESGARRAAAHEAAERARQLQLAAKLHAMRKKKHEYLQYQRQLALQRVQEQEREMQMRQEQQKHHYMMSSGGSYYMPQLYQNTYMNQPNFQKAQSYMPGLAQTSADVPLPLVGQPHTSQANIPMTMNQIGTIPQSMPQIPQTYTMSTPNAVISQMPLNVQASMNLPVHTSLAQQMPMQSQMQLAQMHQMRMSIQPGVHQMMPQNLVNGMPGQNLLQQNGQPQMQIPKQHIPGQHIQPQNPTVTQIGMPPQSMAQPSSTNPHLGMQMQAMKMQMQNPALGSQQIPVSTGYSIPHPQMSGIPSQIPIQSQGMPMPGQQMMQTHGIPSMGSQVQPQPTSTSQTIPTHSQVPSQNQQQKPQQIQSVPMSQGQMPTGQQMNMQGQQMQMPNLASNGHPMPQHQMMNPRAPIQMQYQGQQMQAPTQNPMQQQQLQMQHQMQGQQQMPVQLQGHPPQAHNAMQTIQNPQQQQQFQAQQLPPQGANMQQANAQPQMKIQQQNLPPPTQQPPPNMQQPQTPVKTENNNNTAELISFD